VHVVNVDRAHRRLPQNLERRRRARRPWRVQPGPVAAERGAQAGAASHVFEINDDVQEMQESNPLADFFAQPDKIRDAAAASSE